MELFSKICLLILKIKTKTTYLYQFISNVRKNNKEKLIEEELKFQDEKEIDKSTLHQKVNVLSIYANFLLKYYIMRLYIPIPPYRKLQVSLQVSLYSQSFNNVQYISSPFV